MSNTITQILKKTPSTEKVTLNYVAKELQMSEDSIETFSSELELYNNISNQILILIDLISSSYDIEKPLKDELLNISITALKISHTYSNENIDVDEIEWVYSNHTPSCLKKIPNNKNTIETLINRHAYDITVPVKEEPPKNRQELLESILLEALISIKEIESTKTRKTIQNEVIQIMLTCDRSYTTTTLLDINKSSNENQSSQNELDIKLEII